MKSQSDFLGTIQAFLDQQERPEQRCHLITLDQGSSFTSLAFEAFCQDRGIALFFSATDQHQQNGIAERSVGVVKEIMRRLLMDATSNGVDPKY